LKSIERCYSFAGNVQTKKQTVTRDSSLIHMSEDENVERTVLFCEYVCA